MAKTIEFPAIKPRIVFERDCVVFPVLVGGRPIRCLVTFEALVEDYGARSWSEEDLLEAYERSKQQLHEIVRKKVTFTNVSPENEIVIRSSRGTRPIHRLLHYVPSKEIASNTKLAELLHDVTAHNVGRLAPEGCNLHVHWDFANNAEPRILTVLLEDDETKANVIDWFSMEQLKEPEYVSRRFDFLWAEYLEARSKKQLEKIRAEGPSDGPEPRGETGTN